MNHLFIVNNPLNVNNGIESFKILMKNEQHFFSNKKFQVLKAYYIEGKNNN